MRFLALLPLAALAWAQGLSLKEALDMLPQSPGWQSLEAQYAQAQASYQAAAAALALKFTTSGNVSYLALTGQETWQENLTASLNLGTLPYGPLREAARQAEMALKRAALTRLSGEMDLLLSFLNQYWNAYLAAQNLVLAQKSLALAQEEYKLAQTKRSQGMLSEVGLRQAEVGLRQAEAALDQAQAQEASARSALYATLGRPLGPPPVTPVPDPPPPPSLDEVLKALASRPDVRRAQNALEDAEATLAYAEKARMLPQGTLGVSYGQIATSQVGSNVGISLNLGTGQILGSLTYAPGVTGSEGWRASLNLSFPLLAPDLDTQVAAAQAGLRAQQAALESALASAQADLRARHAAYLAALAQLAVAHGGLAVAEQLLDDTKKRLAAGLATQLDLAQAEQSRQQATYALESARTNAYLAYMALKRAMGKLTLEYVKEVVP